MKSVNLAAMAETELYRHGERNTYQSDHSCPIAEVAEESLDGYGPKGSSETCTAEF